MKTIKNLSSKFCAKTIKKNFAERYGQIFSVNDYEFDLKPNKKTLFSWQLEAISSQAFERFGITIAPCGSGKTLVVQTLAAIDAVDNPHRKQVILVSEEAHADNFKYACDIEFKLRGKKRKVSWAAPEDFTEQTFINSKSKEAKSWLLSDNIFVGKKNFVKGSVAIITHALFNRIFKSCSEKERMDICRNLTLLVDESHHLKGLDPNQDMDMTQLSKAVNFIMDNAESLDCKIFLCTATFFRGDYAVILSKDNLDKFKVYQLEFVRHYLSLGIDNYEIVNCFFEDDPIKQICKNLESCLKKGLKKHYIVVPPLGNWRGNWRLLDPECRRLKEEVIKVLVKRLGYSKAFASTRILDLVDKLTQGQNKKKLSSEPKYGQKIEDSLYDVVITCRIGREGTDWPICSVVHNTSPEKSPTFAVQTIGRALRRHPDKKSVICFYYIRDFMSSDCSKEDLMADRVHYLILTMLMDEYLRPILLPIVKTKKSQTQSEKGKKSSKNDNHKEEYVSMRDVFGDQWDSVKKEIIENFAFCPVTEQNVEVVVNKILAKYDYISDVDVEDIRDGIKVFVLKSKSHKYRNEFIDISFIRKNNFNNLAQGENESLFYKISKNDWKTFQILKEDALAQDQMNLLCKYIPSVKAKELGKTIDTLVSGEYYNSLRDLYDFRDACIQLDKQKKSKCTRALAKMLSVSEDIIKLRINEYNSIFEKMGKPLIELSA
jgi:hypothetical protein